MIVRPESEEELAECVKAATGPLRIVGGGTRSFAAVEGDVLETGGLSGVRLYEPGALTLVAGAGTPLAEIEALVAGEGQALAFEPPDMRGLLGVEGVSTLGGVVAANASGPRRVQAGAARDFALGVRFVDGVGVLIKNGGRVMKNVTGYDLVKLMGGSFGTLGVLSEVSLKVLPAPKTRACVVVQGLDVASAVAVMSSALGSPFEVTGAAHIPADGGARTLLRVEGFDAQVAYRAAQVVELIGQGAVIEEDPKQVAQMWRDVRDVAPLQGGEGDVWRISVAPSDAPAVVADLGAEAVMLDWGGGLIWARMAPGSDVRARMAVAGHATRVRGSGETPVFHPQAAGVATLEAGLRAKFDPRGILNAGLMA